MHSSPRSLTPDVVGVRCAAIDAFYAAPREPEDTNHFVPSTDALNPLSRTINVLALAELLTYLTVTSPKEVHGMTAGFACH